MRHNHVTFVVAAMLALFVLMSASLVTSSDPFVQDAFLEAGQELRVATDCETHEEVAVSIQNRSDGACRCSFTAFRNGEELAEEEFASFSGRTVEIQKNYKKIVGFDCVMEEFVVHMDEGKADIRVSQVSYE